MKPFTVSPEVMKQTKANRLRFLEQQLAETQLSIAILENSVASFNDVNDASLLEHEKTKWDKLVQNYQTVEGVVITDGGSGSSSSSA